LEQFLAVRAVDYSQLNPLINGVVKHGSDD
jgi:hypothetical protein